MRVEPIRDGMELDPARGLKGVAGGAQVAQG